MQTTARTTTMARKVHVGAGAKRACVNTYLVVNNAGFGPEGADWPAWQRLAMAIDKHKQQPCGIHNLRQVQLH